MIIGLTGTKASGKGVVAEMLKERGFVYSSTSDRVREEAVTRGHIDYTIKTLQDIGNELRQTFGNEVLAKRTLEKVKDAQNSVIDGLRNTGEIQELQKYGAIIISVDAPVETRYQRLLQRNRSSDPKNWQGFLEMDRRDKGENESNSGQQVSACIALADYRIINQGDLEELQQDINEVLRIIEVRKQKDKEFEPKKQETEIEIQEQEIKVETKTEKRQDYLSWDEYFIGISLLSAQRSKDPNTQVGACIVDENKKIIGIGYNGFPVGCSDEELPWNREGDFLKTKYPYVCHAELNAILNSTKKLTDCTIYTSLFPCNECAKAIIQSGIKKIKYLSDKYSETDSHKASQKMFDLSGIKYEKIIFDKEIKLRFD